MQIVMGAPNVVLGRSHSGNASATDLADEGLLDILTSDYVPASLLHAPFILAARGMPLHEAIAKVTANPATAIGMTDRGRIAAGPAGRPAARAAGRRPAGDPWHLGGRDGAYPLSSPSSLICRATSVVACAAARTS